MADRAPWSRNRIILQAFGLALSLALAVPTSGTHAAEPLSLLLDWFVNPDHAPLIVAEEKGFFADVGLDVHMTEPADPNDPPKLVAAGQADMAVSYQPQLHIQVAAGLPLVRIAALVATPLNTLVVLADGPVTSLAALAGRTIGYSVGGFEDAVLGAMLDGVGLSLDDVTLVNVNFALTPALLSGQVDGVIGAFRNFELNQLALHDAEGRAFYPEEHGVPPYDELILVVNRNRLDDPRWRRLLDALERATVYLLNHPEESWSLFVRHRPSLDDPLNRLAWRDTLRRFAQAPAALDPHRYRRFAMFLEARGLIEQARPADAYAVTLD